MWCCHMGGDEVSHMTLKEMNQEEHINIYGSTYRQLAEDPWALMRVVELEEIPLFQEPSSLPSSSRKRTSRTSVTEIDHAVQQEDQQTFKPLTSFEGKHLSRRILPTRTFYLLFGIFILLFFILADILTLSETEKSLRQVSITLLAPFWVFQSIGVSLLGVTLVWLRRYALPYAPTLPLLTHTTFACLLMSAGFYGSMLNSDRTSNILLQASFWCQVVGLILLYGYMAVILAYREVEGALLYQFGRRQLTRVNSALREMQQRMVETRKRTSHEKCSTEIINIRAAVSRQLVDKEAVIIAQQESIMSLEAKVAELSESPDIRILREMEENRAIHIELQEKSVAHAETLKELSTLHDKYRHDQREHMRVLRELERFHEKYKDIDVEDYYQLVLESQKWPSERASWESRVAHRDTELESAFATIAQQRTTITQFEHVSSIMAEHQHLKHIVQQHQTHCNNRMEQWTQLTALQAQHQQCQQTIQSLRHRCDALSASSHDTKHVDTTAAQQQIIELQAKVEATSSALSTLQSACVLEQESFTTQQNSLLKQQQILIQEIHTLKQTLDQTKQQSKQITIDQQKIRHELVLSAIAQYDALIPQLGCSYTHDPQHKGVIVTKVGVSSCAALAGIQVNDRIEQVSGISTPNAEIFKDVIKKYHPGDHFAVMISRGGTAHVMLITLGARDASPAQVARLKRLARGAIMDDDIREKPTSAAQVTS